MKYFFSDCTSYIPCIAEWMKLLTHCGSLVWMTSRHWYLRLLFISYLSAFLRWFARLCLYSWLSAVPWLQESDYWEHFQKFDRVTRHTPGANQMLHETLLTRTNVQIQTYTCHTALSYELITKGLCFMCDKKMFFRSKCIQHNACTQEYF